MLMGKRGGKKHTKRIAAPQSVPLHDKKENTWMLKACPGPHLNEYCIPLGVLLKDTMGIAKTSREVKQILSGRLVLVDGRVRTEEKFPVGLMDTVSFQKGKKAYRLVVDYKGRLFPMEISAKDASKKLAKLVGKHTIKKGKVNITLHDGRNILADNNLKVGDSVMVSLPAAKIEDHFKREKGARCLVVEGKHAGSLVKLKDIIERAGGKPPEALVEDESGKEFVTVAGYLFVVDSSFSIEGEAA
ncbi:30S ribosomal protein S4e [Candidatus Micrarchaeota archaeon]|nr:30S ribosomal protein S4e [Candidatus Micrarchaeota archaeon]